MENTKFAKWHYYCNSLENAKRLIDSMTEDDSDKTEVYRLYNNAFIGLIKNDYPFEISYNDDSKINAFMVLINDVEYNCEYKILKNQLKKELDILIKNSSEQQKEDNIINNEQSNNNGDDVIPQISMDSTESIVDTKSDETTLGESPPQITHPATEKEQLSVDKFDFSTDDVSNDLKSQNDSLDIPEIEEVELTNDVAATEEIVTVEDDVYSIFVEDDDVLIIDADMILPDETHVLDKQDSDTESLKNMSNDADKQSETASNDVKDVKEIEPEVVVEIEDSDEESVNVVAPLSDENNNANLRQDSNETLDIYSEDNYITSSQLFYDHYDITLEDPTSHEKEKVELVVYPQKIEKENQVSASIIVGIKFRDKHYLFVSPDEDRKTVIADFEQHSFIIRASWKDGNFESIIIPTRNTLEGEYIIEKEKQTYRPKLMKNPTHLIVKQNDTKIHIIPCSFENEDNGMCNVMLFTDETPKKVLVPDGSNVLEIEHDGISYNVIAYWENDLLFCEVNQY